MPIDPSRDPWSGTFYKGFAGAPGDRPEPPHPPARRRRAPPPALVAGGVVAALALGAVLGFIARPELIGGGDRQASAAPSSQTMASPTPAAHPPAAQVPIAVAPPAPAAAPQPQGRLEILPPEMAAAVRAPAQPHAAGHDAEDAGAVASAANPEAPTVLPLSPPAAAAPAPPGRASFDCATARPGAEQMVCADPQLAAADREMSRAYRRALGSGADPADLRQEQRDWLAIREDAARHSRRALAQVYDQRIQDLDQIADPGDDGDEP